MSRVFVSHATLDKPVGDLVVEVLLEGGLGIPVDDIFYSSSKVHGVPPGKDFKAYIREAVGRAGVVLPLISPRLNASAFSLAELGATWVLAKEIVPLIIPPHDHGELKAVMTGIQALRLDDEEDLDVLRDALAEHLGVKVKSPRWTAKRNEFLKRLPTALAEIKPSTTISAKEHAKLRRKHDEYREAYEEQTRLLDEARAELAEVRKLKDAKQVANIRRKRQPQAEAFEDLVDAAGTALKNLKPALREALFYHLRDEVYVPDGDDWDDLQLHIERDDLVLTPEDRAVEVNADSPRVKPALAALAALRTWIRKAGENFENWYVDQHSEPPTVTSRAFWEAHFP